MKMNRLFEITTILLNKGTATAKELAERFGVSTRTIYRDIDVLSAAGVPVYMNKGNGGGIYLLENYAINRTLITPEESESLLLAIRTLQATQYPELDRILEKLGAMFQYISSHEWVEVDFSPWGSMANEKNKFSDIRQALLQRKVIGFQYVNSKGQKSNRFVEPEKLTFKENAWYLKAYCRLRHEHRTFRISRLKKLEILSETFETKKTPGAETVTEEVSLPFVPVKLRFQARALNKVYDYFDDTYITQNDDGSYTLEVALPDNEWIYEYILSFGNLVEVLEPKTVRLAIVERMKQTLEIYSR
ncbi:MAG: YafY family protein [Sporomusaceae bacterium]|nr:YafY family protein [Sporomusaceae bacterium]